MSEENEIVFLCDHTVQDADQTSYKLGQRVDVGNPHSVNHFVSRKLAVMAGTKEGDAAEKEGKRIAAEADDAANSKKGK